MTSFRELLIGVLYGTFIIPWTLYVLDYILRGSLSGQPNRVSYRILLVITWGFSAALGFLTAMAILLAQDQHDGDARPKAAAAPHLDRLPITLSFAKEGVAP